MRWRSSPEWFERYGSRVENYDLPKTEAARQKLALVIGEDGQRLLQAIDRATDQPWRAPVPAMSALRRVWSEPYMEEQGPWRWREVKDAGDNRPVDLPYDPDAGYSTKRHVEWVGYNVHCTETWMRTRPPDCACRNHAAHHP
jgi:transposase